MVCSQRVIHGESVYFTNSKTETGDLRRDCTGGYSHWHMIAADRRRFFECFGRNAEYRPEEILRITYGRSVLYEANG